MTMSKYDELMAEAPEDATMATPTMLRATATYTSHDEQFRLKEKNFERQYAQLYFYRLMKLRPLVIEAAAAKWPNVPVVTILNLPEDDDAESTEVVVSGTLYKEMSLKPSILDEYDKDRALKHQLGRTHFTQPDDRLVLEDEGARVTLSGTIMLPKDYVTGIVVAVKGRMQPSGELEVTGVCHAGIPPPPPLPMDTADGDKYVALVSGLGIEKEASALQLQMLVDYLCGALGGRSEQTYASKVVRLIVAGGIFKGTSALSQPTTYSAVKQQTTSLAPLKEADMALTEMAACMPIDIMPGAADPANYSLPQQPLHKCLFPGAGSFSTFNSCSNPHSCDIDGVSFLGTSGQNVDDVKRYSDIADCTTILQRLLEWRHLIPTAPDTLAAYPFYDADPFIVESAPHVLFAGGQPAYGSTEILSKNGEKVRVVAVPHFEETGCVVFVNLKTLEAQPMYFESAVGKQNK